MKPIIFMLTDNRKTKRNTECPVCHRSLVDARLLEGGYRGKLNRQFFQCPCGQEVRVYGYIVKVQRALRDTKHRDVKRWQNMARETAKETTEIQARLDRVWGLTPKQKEQHERGLRKLLNRLSAELPQC